MERYDHDPKRLLEILEGTQAVYGFLPVAAIKHISQVTGAWYAMIYGTASFYSHLRFEKPMGPDAATANAAPVTGVQRAAEATYADRLAASLSGRTETLS
jgi:NADH-quinone oxidoreductase subunit E